MVVEASNGSIVCPQFGGFVSVDGYINLRIPFKGSYHILCFQTDLMTPEMELTDVRLNIAESGRVGDINLIQETIRPFSVVIID